MLDDDVWRYLPMGPLPTLVVTIIGVGLFLAVSLVARIFMRRLAGAMLGMITIAILGLTLSGGDASRGRELNLHPGAGVRVELDNVNHVLGLVNILGNAVMFVPLGWLTAVLVLYTPSTTIWVGLKRGALTGLGLSLVIEVSQYFLGRSADVDDVMLNVAGTLLGACVGVALSAVRRARASSAPARAEPGPQPTVAFIPL